MIPRGRIDISYSDIFRGLFYCVKDLLGIVSPIKKSIESENELICLSARTGFNLVLSALSLPPGSEIIVSSISIPDMFSIITHHQLIPVPISINKNTLNTSVTEIKAAISTKTKAILITHLFGAVADMEEIIALATMHNLVVIEDGAQAYAGSDYKGHNKSNVILQSFGMIKTNTAISGSVILFNDYELARKVIIVNHRLPVQPVYTYLKKLIKAFFIRLLTTRWIYTLIYYIINLKKKDIDKILSGFTRGFPGNELFNKISFQPCDPLKRLLTYKIEHYQLSELSKRKQYAKRILSNIPANMLIGHRNTMHTHWVLPISVDHPEKLIGYLRQRGFDATSKASSLVSLRAKIDNVDDLELSKIVYLPLYPKATNKKISLLINSMNDFSAD